jgi:superfamily II DNA or RNA helicase
LCTSENFDGRHVIKLETGCGKTALCFTIACHYAKKGMKVLIVNESEELTFRDYKKAQETSSNLDLQISIVQRGQQIKNITDGLTFVSFLEFTKLFKDLGS